MDWKLEVVVVPVTDVDRAKRFYTEQAGFIVDHDTRTEPGDDLPVARVVQREQGVGRCSLHRPFAGEFHRVLQGSHRCDRVRGSEAGERIAAMPVSHAEPPRRSSVALLDSRCFVRADRGVVPRE